MATIFWVLCIVQITQLTPTHLIFCNRMFNQTFPVFSRYLTEASKLENNRCQTRTSSATITHHPCLGSTGKVRKSTRKSQAERFLQRQHYAVLSAPLTSPSTPKAPLTSWTLQGQSRSHLDSFSTLRRYTFLQNCSSLPLDEFLSPQLFLYLSDIKQSSTKCQPHTHFTAFLLLRFSLPQIGKPAVWLGQG